MSTNTNNYKLIKPAQEDFYNVDDFNNNADIIDSQLKAVSDKAEAALPATSYTATDILNKLKTVDGNGSGLDADLFKGQSVIPVANGGTGNADPQRAIRNLNGDGIFLERTSLLDGINDSDVGGFNLFGRLRTSTTPINIPNFFSGNARVVVNCFYSGAYECKLATQDYTNEVAIKTGTDNDWLRVVTNNNIAEMVQSALQSGGISVIKSIQRGSIAITTDSQTNTRTATISPVNTAKAIVVYTGMATSIDNLEYYPHLTLTDSTTITATRAELATNGSTSIPYQVIEFY